MQNNPIWLDSDQTIAEMCEYVNLSKIVAIDTEFIQSYQYWPTLSIIQFCTVNGTVYLFDALKHKYNDQLLSILRSEHILKIGHSLRQDIYSIYSHFNVTLHQDAIQDTQILATKCNIGTNIGYADLLYRLLDVKILKDVHYKTWQNRPLSAKQMSYLCNDVKYLMPVYNKMIAMPNSDIYLQEMKEELKNMTMITIEDFAKKSYDKLSKHRNIARSNDNLYNLKKLCSLREEYARSKNKRRVLIADDSVLLRIAMENIDNISQLSKYHLSNPFKDAILKKLSE